MLSRALFSTRNIISAQSSTAVRTFASSSVVAPTLVSSLDNGFRVASEDGSGETATIALTIDAGSRFENEKNNGVAHFLEHLSFKGTKNRTQTQLEKEIENLGAHLNAYTSREQTVYVVRSLKKDVNKAVEILADIVTNSNLSEESIERERSVIKREAEEVNMKAFEVLMDQLHATAYQGSSLGRTILGPLENIDSITRADVQTYIDTHYTAPRMVLSGAGAVNHTQLVELAQKHFSGVPAVSKHGIVAKEGAHFVGSDVRVEDEFFPESHVAIGFEGPGWAHADMVPLTFVQSLVGSWSQASLSGRHVPSPLGRRLASEHLALSMQPFATNYTDTSIFGVHAVSQPDKLEDLSYEILNEYVRLCFKVTPAEVDRVRNQLKSSVLMGLDNTSAVAEDIGRQMIVFGRRITPKELFERFDAVTVPSIQEVAQKYIYDKDVVVAGVGSGVRKDLPDYNRLRRWTYWLRY